MNPVAETFDWIERHHGTLNREDLLRLVSRLRALPCRTRSVLLDWSGVTHLDFRGIEPVVDELSALQARGITIRLAGIDRYLLSIIRLSVTGEEGFERFLGTAERAERGSAQGRNARHRARVPWWLTFPISRN
jgi:ABC-type transporter Mla MlaB component